MHGDPHDAAATESDGVVEPAGFLQEQLSGIELKRGGLEWGDALTQSAYQPFVIGLACRLNVSRVVDLGGFGGEQLHVAPHQLGCIGSQGAQAGQLVLGARRIEQHVQVRKIAPADRSLHQGRHQRRGVDLGIGQGADAE